MESTMHSQRSFCTLVSMTNQDPSSMSLGQRSSSGLCLPTSYTRYNRGPRVGWRLYCMLAYPLLLRSITASQIMTRFTAVQQTFKFSTCLSPGVPQKPSRYGGNSELLDCANSMTCCSGMAHSDLVNSRVVIDSCQIRRLVWMDEVVMSKLNQM